MVKDLTTNTQIWSLGWEDPLEEGMATHSRILSWRIPLTEELGAGPLLTELSGKPNNTGVGIRSDQSLSRVRLFATP